MRIDTILNNSTAVRTLVHPKVRSSISNISADFDSVSEYNTKIVEWLKPIIDLSNYYVYPTNGITEGLNWWLAHEHRSIHTQEGEYQWIKSIDRGRELIHYMSVPSAIDGNYKDIPNDAPVALDLAYVGSTRLKHITISENVEYVFYSLSKPFGIRNIRTGWIFTKKPQHKLDALIYGAKYYNYFAHQVSEKIIENFDVKFIHNQYADYQIKICNQFDLVPSDSVWIATSKDVAYEKFRRRENVARLCLAGVYYEEA